MARKTKMRCARCGNITLHENRLVDGKTLCVCLNCELLEQQVREGEKPGAMGKNTSSSSDPKDVYETLRSWGGPFGGGLAGGG